MGINLGAFIGPLLTGFLAQDARFRALITGWGMDPNSAWHLAFGAAGVGMTLGLIQYVVDGPRAIGIGGAEARRRDHAGAGGEATSDRRFVTQEAPPRWWSPWRCSRWPA